MLDSTRQPFGKKKKKAQKKGVACKQYITHTSVNLKGIQE